MRLRNLDSGCVWAATFVLTIIGLALWWISGAVAGGARPSELIMLVAVVIAHGVWRTIAAIRELNHHSRVLHSLSDGSE